MAFTMTTYSAVETPSMCSQCDMGPIHHALQIHVYTAVGIVPVLQASLLLRLALPIST